MKNLDVTIVSDVICPWCFIGTRRLGQVLGAMDDVAPRLRYRAFLLDADVPPEGADLRERLRRKYGVDPEGMFRRIEEAARDTGITLDFSRITRTPNTVAAHTLLRHAVDKGTQPALSEALFAAYFLDGQDIGEAGVLAAIAVAHGFTHDEALRLAGDAAELAATRMEAEEAAQAGVRGVPFFVFANRLALSGAQPSHVFREAIARALAPADVAG
jgi:predicted DsbA family dithiol-disulfide isomerase